MPPANQVARDPEFLTSSSRQQVVLRIVVDRQTMRQAKNLTRLTIKPALLWCNESDTNTDAIFAVGCAHFAEVRFIGVL